MNPDYTEYETDKKTLMNPDYIDYVTYKIDTNES